MSPRKVLVTGCGGDIAQAIGRTLRELPGYGPALGADVHEDHAGAFVFERVFVLPTVRDAGYLAALRALLAREKPAVLLPMSEAELRFLHAQGITGALDGVPVLAANPRALEVGLDKWRTAELLRELGLPHPRTELLTEHTTPRAPCVLKARRGAGSKAVVRVDDEAAFRFYAARMGDAVVQELLLPDDQEYTCGLFRSPRAGETRTLVLRRTLAGGLTGRGEVVVNEAIDAVLRAIAEALDLRGSINAQLRLTASGPCVFEINPRFSSTVRFRHLLGYRDLRWSLQDLFDEPLEPYTPPAPGTRFYRTYDEVLRAPTTAPAAAPRDER